MRNNRGKLRVASFAATQGAGGARRPGITLTEVLVSMGVLAIGLLSVAAMFPVGGHYMRSGEIADRGSAVAQAAFADVVARGVLRPENWLAMGSPARYAEIGNTDFTTLQYSKPFLPRFRQAILARQSGTMNAPIPMQIVQAINGQFGSVFVIDPLGVAGFMSQQGSPGTGPIRFPFNGSLFVTPRSRMWDPWLPSGQNGLNHPKWPIVRLTVPDGTGPMNLEVARQVFGSRDDLAIELPEDASAPPIQRWETIDLNGDNSATEPAARSWQGDYSWIVTLAPTNQEARDAVAGDPSAHNFNVSTVVFYKRVLGDAVTNRNPGRETDDYSPSEPIVRARVLSTGTSGGELLLTHGVSPSPNPFEHLQAGHWLLLFGPHPNSTNQRQVFFFNWYRILTVQGEDTKLDDNGNPSNASNLPERRLVALRGPNWPWRPENNSSPELLSNDLRVGIFPGAVAVHSKTMRLEGPSVWSIE